MTRDHSDAHTAGPADTERPAPDETPAAATSPLAEPPVAALEATPDLPAIVIEAVDPSNSGETDNSFGVATAFFLDASPLTQKSLEIWDENLNALMAHMESLAGVKTFEEAVALQTRFATQCFESFERQSRDLVALTQQLATVGVAPLCGTRAAA